MGGVVGTPWEGTTVIVDECPVTLCWCEQVRVTSVPDDAAEGVQSSTRMCPLVSALTFCDS